MWHARFLYEARPPFENPIIIITSTPFEPHCFVLVVRSFALTSATSISISPKMNTFVKMASHHVIFFSLSLLPCLFVCVCVICSHGPQKKMANFRLICRARWLYQIINMNNERVFIKMNKRKYDAIKYHFNCIVFR